MLTAALAGPVLGGAPAASADPVSVPGPIISTLAGSVICCGDLGDNGPATAAILSGPEGVAVDSTGNVYIADTGANRVRRVDPVTGIITTFAGGGNPADFVGDGLPATQAFVSLPFDVAIDPAGNVYIAAANRVRRVDIATGIITTYAGNGESGYSGDGGPATHAQLWNPQGLTFDAAGNLYIADRTNNRVRRVDPSGTITTVAGGGSPADGIGDGLPATQAQLDTPLDVAVDSAGNLYVTEDGGHNRVRRVDATTGIITTVAGGGSPADGIGDGLPATQAQLAEPTGVVVDPAGNIYIGDRGHNRVRKVDAATGIITSYAGSGGTECSVPLRYGDGLPATQAEVCRPARLAFDVAGNLYIASPDHARIRVVGVLSITKAGTPDPVPVGGLLTYTLSVGNFSTTAANDVRVTDILPAGVAVVAAKASQGKCSVTGGTVDCKLRQLAPGTGAIVRILVTAPADPGVLTNTASFVADHPDTVRVDNTATDETTVGEPALQLTKVGAPDPVRVGKPVTYTLKVFNGLATTATGVTVSDALPAGFTFMSATTSQGSCSQTGGTVSCQLGDLPYQGVAYVKVRATPNQTGTFTNTATVTSAEAPAPVGASFDSRVSAAACGLVITRSMTLRGDIGPCGLGDGIVIGADGITVDLGGHRVFGFPEPGAGTVGIRLPNRSNVTVRNGTVSGFDAGVLLRAGGSNMITGITARDNIGPDDLNADLGDGIVLFNSPANHIVGNTLIHNGVFDGIGVLGPESDDNVIEGNTVEDTVGPSNLEAAGQGIIVSASSELGEHEDFVMNNVRVANNTVRRNASAGIANLNNIGGSVLGNVVEDNGHTNAFGNGIGVQLSPGFFLDVETRMLISNNEVHGNGQDGIQVAPGATNNRILDNDAADNNTTGHFFAFDLHDFNPDCDNNTWSGNIWGSGGYDPSCTTVGGSGPNPPAPPVASAAAGPTAMALEESRDVPVVRHLPRG